MNARIMRLLFGILIGLVLAGVILVWPVSMASAISTSFQIMVTTTADKYGVGTGCSLREAIQAANNGADFGGCVRAIVIGTAGPDTILLPSATYTLTRPGPNEDLNVTGDLDLRASVIISATGATPPIVTGDIGWADRIFDVFTGTATINGITISGGSAALQAGGGMRIASSAALIMNEVTLSDNSAQNGFGGGIYNAGTMTLTDVTLSDNSAYLGGGIENFGGTATLTNVTFSGNSASGYGGSIDNEGTVTLANVTLSSSSAIYGGGLNNATTAVLTNIKFSGNSASGYGGSIDNEGTATLENVTLSSSAASYGGGIYNANTAILADVTLSGNTAPRGGGIDNVGTITLTNVILSRNSASIAGGGIENDGTASLTNSTLGGSSAPDGGGIFNTGTLTLTNVTLSSNTAAVQGGGLSNGGATTLTNDTLSINSASNGGGIYNYSAIILTNVTLSGNSAAEQGGGIYNGNLGTAALRNATLSNNSASLGGALFEAGSTLVLTNTIIAYSPSGGNCYGSITASKFTFSSDYTCALPSEDTIKGQDPNGLDPLLTALGNYGGPTQVHMLKLGSPAIDGIVGSDAPSTDQRGFARPQGLGYDIGAVERQPSDSDLAPRVYLQLIVR